MLVVYHEAFSDRYLVTLVPSGIPEDAGLAAHWDRACHSRKIDVWIDCRLVKTLFTIVALVKSLVQKSHLNYALD